MACQYTHTWSQRVDVALSAYPYLETYLNNNKMANIYHRVIIACRSQIVSELQKGDLNSLADGFYQNGMLAPPERDDIQSGKDKVEKARILTDALENRVQHYPHNYQHFIKMLTERSSQFHALTLILKNKMSELKLEERDGESRPNSARTYISQDSFLSELEDSYIRVECCGNCDTNDFINGKNCPNSPPKSPPFLSMCTQKEQGHMKFSGYRQSMMEQTHDINSKHKALLLHTTQELKEKVPLDVVKHTVKSLLSPRNAKASLYTCIYNCGTKGRLRDVGTHDELELYLENNFSYWFNIQLITDLRKVLLLKGEHDRDTYVCRYKEHVAQYLQRSCVKQTIRDTESGKKYMEIECRVSTDFTKLKPEQIRIFEHLLRQYVIMPDCSNRVDEESGELIFREKEPTTNQQVINHLNQDLGATESIGNNSTDSILQGHMEIRTREQDDDSCCLTKKLCLCSLAIIIPCFIPCIVVYCCKLENNRDVDIV